MSELAYTMNGDTFEVPATVTDWRVRRLKPRGAPELVYGGDGRPLTLSIEAGLDELHDVVPLSGKYRLDPIGGDGKAVENVPAAYIQVTKAARNAANDQAPERSTSEIRASGTSGGLELAVLEAVRLNAEAMRYAAEVNAAALRQNSEISMRALDKLDKMPDMMAAMATLLNVAAGTQLHALQQRALPPQPIHRNDAGESGDDADDTSHDADENDDDDDDDVEDQGPASAVGSFLKAAGFDMNRFLNDVTSKGFSFIHGAARKINGPAHGPNAAPHKDRAEAQQGAAVSAEVVTAPGVVAATMTTHVPAGTSTTSPPPPAEPVTNTPVPSSLKELLSDPDYARRFAAVRKALSAAEQTLVIQVIQAYDEPQVVEWLATLLALPVPEAVATVRAELARLQAHATQQQPQDVERADDDSEESPSP